MSNPIACADEGQLQLWRLIAIHLKRYGLIILLGLFLGVAHGFINYQKGIVFIKTFTIPLMGTVQQFKGDPYQQMSESPIAQFTLSRGLLDQNLGLLNGINISLIHFGPADVDGVAVELKSAISLNDLEVKPLVLKNVSDTINEVQRRLNLEQGPSQAIVESPTTYLIELQGLLAKISEKFSAEEKHKIQYQLESETRNADLIFNATMDLLVKAYEMNKISHESASQYETRATKLLTDYQRVMQEKHPYILPNIDLRKPAVVVETQQNRGFKILVWSCLPSALIGALLAIIFVLFFKTSELDIVGKIVDKNILNEGH